MAHRRREVLSKAEHDALRELKANKDLVIVPADKGRSTVVLGRTNYLQKAKGLLEDRPSYVPCAKNPLKTLTREINATLLSLENPGAITPTDRRMDLAIETIELLLQSKYDETENRLGHARVLQLLKFCLRTYFTFDGTIYEQVKGTPMGSPISGFIAEAVLQRLESLDLQHHRPKFWTWYVNDIFVVIDRNQLLTFKERLNAVFHDIQFTIEEEENNQLTFVDVLVSRRLWRNKD
ncbi:Acyl-CoA synthetase member 2 mitochondrial [Sparganum proliferum]